MSGESLLWGDAHLLDLLGAEVRRYFESTNPRQREDMKPVEGVVERYNQWVNHFRIRYPSQRVGDDASVPGDDGEDLYLMTQFIYSSIKQGDSRG